MKPAPGKRPPTAGLQQAMGLHQAGRLREAEALYADHVKAHPRDADALYLLGIVQAQRGNPHAAIRTIGAAIGLKERMAPWHHTLGLALASAMRFADATKAFSRALELDPRLEPARVDLATAYGRLAEEAKTNGDRAGEVMHARKAADVLPKVAWTWHNLGNALHRDSRFADAAEAFERSIALGGMADAQTHLSYGAVLLELLRPEDAEAQFRIVLAAQPTSLKAYSNLATALKDQERTEEALEIYRMIAEREPNHTAAILNYGNALRDNLDLDAAIAAYDRALEIDPSLEDAINSRASAYLQKGDFVTGWRLSDVRFKVGDGPKRARHAHLPAWTGGPIDGRLLVWGEQGVGDVVLYGTMLQDALGMGVKIVLEVDPRLVPLFARAMPELDLVPHTKPTDERLNAKDITAQIAIGSLGKFLRRSAADFARTGPYLTADAGRTAELRDRYLTMSGGRPLVGVSWRSVNRKFGRGKSTKLIDWAPILTCPDVMFIDLQYGDTQDERQAVEERLGVCVLRDETVDALADLDAFAAQVAALDLTVTTSNTTAHFAGALGAPGVVLLPRRRGLLWYWAIDSESTLWYPHLRLIRQTINGDWSGPMRKAADIISQLRRPVSLRTDRSSP